VLRRDLETLARRRHDVVIVGGGIHGAAAAWEAASRGLSVGLMEADDFGGGASWNSLKTIHGGLRHLQRLDVVGLRESAREQRALMTMAPALVRPLRFVALADGHGAHGRAALALGVAAADLLARDLQPAPAADGSPRRSRRLAASEVRPFLPGAPDVPRGGVLWWDAQVDSSERLLLALLHAAADAGAVVANRLAATGLLRDEETVVGVVARDALTGAAIEVRGAAVLNAAGPDVDAMARAAGVPPPKVTPLRAVNLVLSRPIVREAAVGARDGGRYLFAVPWRDRSLVGTAYGPVTTPGRELAARLLEDAARAFPWAGLVPADVALVHEGVVPAGRGGRRLATRSRLIDHDHAHGVPGLLTVVAAKYTTARAVAEEAVDVIEQRLERPHVPSRTASTPLPEARLLDGPLRDRARIAVQKEMALSLADAVLRRLDLGSGGEPPAEDVGVVASVMAHEFGWDLARIAAERAAVAAFYADRRLR
jgi:glycerol-3-phosphate dehydrogenase